MKKKLILAAVFAVAILAGAAFFLRKEAEPAPPTAETNAPVQATKSVAPTVPVETSAPTEPEWEPGVSRAAYGEAVYTHLELGTQVDVIGAFKDYYVIAGREYDLLVEKCFIRLEGEEPFESWDGYAAQGAKVFESVPMIDSREPIAELAENTQVAVLEGKDGWLYIQWENGRGYIAADQISQQRIIHGGGGTGGGGSGSASADGTDVSVDSLAAPDFRAGIVLLGDYYGPEMEEEFAACKGVVIAHNVAGYICLLSRGDEVKVIGYDGEFCAVYLEDGLTAQLSRWLLRLEGDGEYESWTGYAGSSTAVYEEYRMRSEMMTLKVNTEILVLDKLPGCYVVMVEDVIGYMEHEAVSETEIVSGGGGGSGGDVWTPPAL